MSHPQGITVKEVCDLAEDFFHGVASGESGSSIARLFRYGRHLLGITPQRGYRPG